MLALQAHVVHPPSGGPPRERFAREVETGLAALGWVVSARLLAAIASIPKPQADAWADWLLATIHGDVGGDRAWVPLYRRSRHSTDRLYVKRMLAAYFQADILGCVLCGASDSVQPVQPCGHLVCRLRFRSGRVHGLPDLQPAARSDRPVPCGSRTGTAENVCASLPMLATVTVTRQY